jgi:hypothetical protein
MARNLLPRPAGAVGSYGRLAALLARMVDLARQREWALLPALDAECDELVARLHAVDEAALSTLERARIVVLAHRIRGNQQELQRLVQPHFLHLMRKIHALHAGEPARGTLSP